MVLKHKGSPSGPYALEKTTLSLAFGTVTSASIKRVTAALADLRTTDMLVASFPGSATPGNVGVVGAICKSAGVAEITLINPTALDVAVSTVVMDISILRFS